MTNLVEFKSNPLYYYKEAKALLKQYKEGSED
jgi:hypothetical protein